MLEGGRRIPRGIIRGDVGEREGRCSGCVRDPEGAEEGRKRDNKVGRFERPYVVIRIGRVHSIAKPILKMTGTLRASSGWSDKVQL